MKSMTNTYIRMIYTAVFLITFSGARAVQAEEDHSHHHMMMKNTQNIQVSTHNYSLPDIKLTRLDGELISINSVIRRKQPVILNYIFTTCTTICPVLSGTFSSINQQSAKSDQKIELVSISIDPEHDTPGRLADYAKNFKADKHWQFFTGELQDVINLQKAMDVYRGSKMNHIPVTFIYNPDKDVWTRIEGFASASVIMENFKSTR